jgi:hypothetical protein
MKNLYLLILLLLSSWGFSQKAPNFEITDFDGVTHNLYEDYLDEGVVVMLKIMFVDCPPCNSIAPSVRTLWEDFGGVGNGEVQFFDLSNKNWDNNSDVKGYSTKHGLTFPGAGKDGGSLEAVAPYENGDFGPFFGTPTFVVIGKDGSVEFKVAFNNLKSTIQAKIDEEVETPINGVVVNVDGVPMEGVELRYRNPGDTSVTLATTDVNGEYSFSSEEVPAQAGCVIFPYRVSEDHLEGVSTRDIISILRHILQKDTLPTPLHIKAADVDASGSVSVRDLVEIRKMILGLSTMFPSPTGMAFIVTEDNVPGELEGRSEVLFSDLLDGTVEANFSGMRVGDVVK